MYICKLYELKLQYNCQWLSNNSSPEFIDWEVLMIDLLSPDSNKLRFKLIEFGQRS